MYRKLLLVSKLKKPILVHALTCLQIRRRIRAMGILTTALSRVASKSLASRRQRLIQVKGRSTSHRRGSRSKLFLAASGRPMISSFSERGYLKPLRPYPQACFFKQLVFQSQGRHTPLQGTCLAAKILQTPVVAAGAVPKASRG